MASFSLLLYSTCFKYLFYDLVFKLHLSQLSVLGLGSRSLVLVNDMLINVASLGTYKVSSGKWIGLAHIM